MKANYGMINNQKDIERIMTEGKATEWVETGWDRDGWETHHIVKGYEYKGKRYIIRTDRDGWAEAVER